MRPHSRTNTKEPSGKPWDQIASSLCKGSYTALESRVWTARDMKMVMIRGEHFYRDIYVYFGLF